MRKNRTLLWRLLLETGKSTQKPRKTGITTKDTTNALPIIPPSSTRYHPKKKRDADKKELVTIAEK